MVDIQLNNSFILEVAAQGKKFYMDKLWGYAGLLKSQSDKSLG